MRRSADYQRTDIAVTADDIETNRLRAILVEQRELLTDDLRKADPARWARAQIALGDAYVAIDPPRLKLPGLDESYEFRTATRRPDLPMAAYSKALSEAPHLTANEFVRALVRRGSLNSGRPHAVYDCQHAVIGRIPEAGRDRSEILPFIGKRLFDAPAGIDDRNYCDARAGLAEALIAFAITGVNRAWGNEPVLFSDGVRPYLDEAVAAARAAVSRQAPASQVPATIGRSRRVLMMALAALGAATADAALYDEAVAVGSLAAEEQRPERAAPEWQLLHHYLARTLEAREALRPAVGVPLAQIADCYRIAMEQPLFGDRTPIAEHLVRVVRRQAERENLTIDQFIVQSALTLPEATPAARVVWAAEAAMFAARTMGETALPSSMRCTLLRIDTRKWRSGNAGAKLWRLPAATLMPASWTLERTIYGHASNASTRPPCGVPGLRLRSRTAASSQDWFGRSQDWPC
jgi:hypothetical protein